VEVPSSTSKPKTSSSPMSPPSRTPAAGTSAALTSATTSSKMRAYSVVASASRARAASSAELGLL